MACDLHGSRIGADGGVVNRGLAITFKHEAVKSQIAAMENDGCFDESVAEVYGEGVIQIVHAVDNNFGGRRQSATSKQGSFEVVDNLEVFTIEAQCQIAGRMRKDAELKWRGGSNAGRAG